MTTTMRIALHQQQPKQQQQQQQRSVLSLQQQSLLVVESQCHGMVHKNGRRLVVLLSKPNTTTVTTTKVIFLLIVVVLLVVVSFYKYTHIIVTWNNIIDSNYNMTKPRITVSPTNIKETIDIEYHDHHMYSNDNSNSNTDRYKNNNNNNNNITIPNGKTIILYHEMRTDRSGSVIYDMLLAHAYTMYSSSSSSRSRIKDINTNHDRMIYGGACYYQNNTLLVDQQQESRIRTHRSMIQVLGLSHVLQIIDCSIIPNDTLNNPNNKNNNNNILFIQNRHIYTRYGVKQLFTREWIQHIRSQSQRIAKTTGTTTTHIIPSQQQEQQGQQQQQHVRDVVIHIRRGDVSLCNEHVIDRYLPNSYYRTLIQQYIVNNDNTDAGRSTTTTTSTMITIYSEYNSTESWDYNFLPIDSNINHGSTTNQNSINNKYQIQMKFDTMVPPHQIWEHIMDADFVILSMSTFSYIPALFNTNTKNNWKTRTRGSTILYTPYWIPPPPSLITTTASTGTGNATNWMVVNNTLVQSMKRTKIRLHHELCHLN